MIGRVTVSYMYGNLQQELFTFWLDEYTYTLKLDEYQFQVRQTKRHGWKTLQRWSRLSSRDSNIERDVIILTDDIRQAALHEFISRFTVEE
jgi:hypothetical protein